MRGVRSGRSSSTQHHRDTASFLLGAARGRRECKGLNARAEVHEVFAAAEPAIGRAHASTSRRAGRRECEGVNVRAGVHEVFVAVDYRSRSRIYLSPRLITLPPAPRPPLSLLPHPDPTSHFGNAVSGLARVLYGANGTSS